MNVALERILFSISGPLHCPMKPTLVTKFKKDPKIVSKHLPDLSCSTTTPCLLVLDMLYIIYWGITWSGFMRSSMDGTPKILCRLKKRIWIIFLYKTIGIEYKCEYYLQQSQQSTLFFSCQKFKNYIY